MLAKIFSASRVGLQAVLITVDVDIASRGLPSFTIVGLGDRSVEESKERVRAALINTGADFPAKRITINLAPADLPKEGPAFDLSIAIGVLQASGQISSDFSDSLILGELSLDGKLSPIHGVLAYAILAKELGLKKIFLPLQNAKEAALIEGLEVYGFSDLLQVFNFLTNQIELLPTPPTELSFEDLIYEYDFKDVKGQEQAKRALEIAAAGAHNILLKGPPGAGKTLLARSLPSILPKLSKEEVLEVTKIYSISGNLSNQGQVIKERPFRSPHHTASFVGIIGGGNNIKPGEISLAHRGVLFLDELPEFPRQVLEGLRQPMEDRNVTISRASGSLTFPAQFMLLAAQNPCPCGFYGSINKKCVCLPGQISKYNKKISGPILDRIDIYLDVPAVEVEKLSIQQDLEDSKTIRNRVEGARETQRKRFTGTKILTNSEMSSAQIKQYAKLNQEAVDLLKMAIVRMNLSARGYIKIIKLSRTIADLAGSENILSEHLAESLTYRASSEIN